MNTITSHIMSNREIEQRASAAADETFADFIRSGYTRGRALHESAITYDRTEAALMRNRRLALAGQAVPA